MDEMIDPLTGEIIDQKVLAEQRHSSGTGESTDQVGSKGERVAAQKSRAIP